MKFDNEVIIAHNAEDTSIEAAENALPFSGTMKERVYDFIKSQGQHGATDDEGQEALNMSGNSYRPSRKMLQQAGIVVKKGITRPNKNGNNCIVWIVVSGM
jgi:hypothetical protein